MQINFEKYFERLEMLKGSKNTSQFANFCKIPQPTMHQYLNRRSLPGIEAIMKICIAKVISADWLLGFTDDPKGTAAPATDPALAALIAEKDAEIARLKGKIEGLELAFTATGKGK